MKNLIKLVLIRHGESQWNYENRFTGWTDIDLSERGRLEAKDAGKILKKEGFFFDFSYTSVLKRAIHTLWYILDEIDQVWLPVEKIWRLNERHYGALQGMNKKIIAEKYGEAQVKQWRRSFNAIPPELNRNDERFPGNDIRYSSLSFEDLPTSESLKSTVNRIEPYLNSNILPKIKNKERIIIVAHGNSIRAIVKLLDNLNEQEIFKINIPTGIPLVYEFDNNMKKIKDLYLK